MRERKGGREGEGERREGGRGGRERGCVRKGEREREEKYIVYYEALAELPTW